MDQTSTPLPPLPPQPPLPPKPSYLVLLIAGLALFLGGLGGGLVLSQYVASPKPKIEPITQVAEIPTPTPLPAVVSTKEGDPIAGWITYVKNGLLFKYPPDWTETDNTLTVKSPAIKVDIVPKDSTLMNECMQETSSERRAGFVIKKFSRVTTGAMCGTSDATPRQIWIMPSASIYSPGIIFNYSESESVQSEKLFDQILSTFRFL